VTTRVILTLRLHAPARHVAIWLVAGGYDWGPLSNLDLRAKLDALPAEQVRRIEPTRTSDTEVIAEIDSPQGLFTLCVDTLDPDSGFHHEHWAYAQPWQIRGNKKSIDLWAPKLRPKTHGPLNKMRTVNPPAPSRRLEPARSDPPDSDERGATDKVTTTPWWKFWRRPS
jgi:hypothetical protein